MRRLFTRVAGFLCVLAGVAAAQAHAQESAVGIRAVEFADNHRTLALWVFYPAATTAGGRPFTVPFTVGLDLVQDAPADPGAARRPLVMFSHGRGSNGLFYAWFAQYLAKRGYIVAALNHYRANSYDSNIAYLSNRIWQRPVDLGLAISFLLRDRNWAPLIDPDRIGVAGHSQGGFTSLWIGGAKVNAEKFLAFQNGWRNNRSVPEYLRRAMPLDPAPALDVADSRIKAAFAMAPGIIQAFGMDEAGLGAMAIPAYLTVGARDTQTPPGPNAEFAARHIKGAELAIIPGPVDHEIFTNLCDDEGQDEFPEACIDAPGVDRAAIHESVGAAAVKFFGTAFGLPPKP